MNRTQLEQEGGRLTNRFDQDPGPWRPFHYTTLIEVPVAYNGIGRNIIRTNQQPFILQRISQQIIGATGDPESSGLYQDGQFLIAYRDEMSVYQKEPTPANTLCGNPAAGYISWLPMPLGLAGSRSLEFEITNQVTRVLSPESDYFVVAITVHGMNDWGQLEPPSMER